MVNIINDLKSLALNVFFILITLFFYQVFWLDNPKVKRKNKELLFLVLCILVIVLCMSFPFSFHPAPGFFFDLRAIPLIIGSLYGGKRFALVLFLVMISYRCWFGGNGFYAAILVNTALFICFLFLESKFKPLTSKKKIVVLVQLSLVYSIITCMALLYFSKSTSLHFFSFASLYTVIQVICMWMTAYSIETIKNNLSFRETAYEIEKMKVVSELAASVSHEIKNPLTVVKGFIQLLRESKNLDEGKQDYFLEISLEELIRTESIISDYLSFAKHDMGSIDPLDLGKEILYAVNVLTPFIHMNGVEISAEVTGECWVLGDRQKFRQCLINLLKNSVESMEDGGKLSLGNRIEENRAHIFIRDTGIGMTPEQVKRLGTPFYSTKEKGTGLGTMVAFSILRAMGGEIEIQSARDKGTWIQLYLPIHKKD